MGIWSSLVSIQQIFLKDISGILVHVLQAACRSKHSNSFFWKEGVYTLFFYTLAEGILISVRCLQRSVGDVSDPIKYIYS